MNDNIVLKLFLLFLTAIALGFVWGLLLPSPLSTVVSFMTGIPLGWNWDKVWDYLTGEI